MPIEKLLFASVQLRPRLSKMIPEYYCAESIETSVARKIEGTQEQAIQNSVVDKCTGQAQQSDCLFSSSAPLSSCGRLNKLLSPDAHICKRYLIPIEPLYVPGIVLSTLHILNHSLFTLTL